MLLSLNYWWTDQRLDRGGVVVSKKIMAMTDTVQMEAELNDSKTAALIWEALPISAEANTWGDEIYFSIETEIKPASPVNLIGRFSGDPELWKKVAAGDTIRLEAVRE